MSANLTSSVGESASRTVDLDAQASRWTDGELSARFQSDVIPLREPLYRHAVRLTRNHADAEDLVQETIVWLHRILINTYISGYRKLQCRPVQHPTADITDMELAANTANLASGLRSAEEQ